MKTILYIFTLGLLAIQLGNISYATDFIDEDRDKIQDNAIDEKKRDKDPNTSPEDVKYVCTILDIEQYQPDEPGFIGFDCKDYGMLGRFSQKKKDSTIDSDKDGVYDLYDVEPNTKPENTKYVCREYEIKNQIFNDCRSGDLGRFSQKKKDTLVDTDRDGVKDFEDRQRNTPQDQRNYVCTQRDINHPSDSIKYNCLNDSQLGVFSSTKQRYILDDGFNPGGNGNGGIGIPGSPVVDGGQIQNGGLNLDTGNIKEGVERNDPLKDLQEDGDGFIRSDEVGERGIYDVLVTAARDLKNIFFLFATIFFLYLVIRLLFSENSEEDTSKFKRGVLWVTVGIIVMQLAYSFVLAVYDGGLGSELGKGFVDVIIQPLIQLLETLASFFFIIMGIVAFYRLVTSNGEEQAATDAKTTMINAILGFIMVQLAAFIVGAVYNASSETPVSPGGFTNIIIGIINWINGFVGIAVIIMIIYAGAQVLLSGGNEEKLATAKKALLYIIIGISLLLMNFIILTFFFNSGASII